MRIGLTVEALSPQLTGIGRYTWELVRHYRSERPDIRYFRNGQWIAEPSALVEGDGRPPRSPLPGWMKKARSKILLHGCLLHGPNYFLPPSARNGIITVHDLSVLRFPETHPIERVRQFERDFTRSLGRAAHVITDCETVREEVIAMLGVPAERITAVPLGVGVEYAPRDAESLGPILARYGLEADGYALSVSTLEPRKKIGALLQAWRGLEAALRARWPLTLIGGNGWHSSDLEALIEEGRRAGWCRYLGFVPQADMSALYAGARLFLYPSTYEGFGLPPIEAMASGVPTIVSNVSCLPEVTQGAAMMIDPNDHAAFIRAIVQGLSDETWRGGARQSGLGVAAGYRWDRCAERTLGVYRTVLEKGAAPI